MKTYQVVIVKPVTDYLRAFVTVQAETEDEAIDKADQLAEDGDLFRYWTSGETLESKTYEATEIAGGQP